MKNYLIIAFTLLTGLLCAQDTIVRIDSSRIVAKVLSVTDKIITYTRYKSPDGPKYETSRRTVARIIYADGTTEYFGKTINEEFVDKHKNIVSLTTTDLVTGVITANYERIVAGKVGLRFTFSMGVLGTSGKKPDYYTNSYYYNRYKLFSAGTDIHFYAYRGRYISYYAGALMEYGRVRTTDYYWDFPPYYPTSQIRDYFFGGLTNGMAIHATEHLQLDMYCSLGWRHMVGDIGYYGGYSDYAARLGFSLGYRF